MIIQNALYCKKCKTMIVSKSRHDYTKCKCGNVSVDGGADYFKISCLDSSLIEDYSITSDNFLSLTKENPPRTNLESKLLWGVFNEVSKTIEYKRLSSLSKDHLKAILNTQKNISFLYKLIIIYILYRN